MAQTGRVENADLPGWKGELVDIWNGTVDAGKRADLLHCAPIDQLVGLLSGRHLFPVILLQRLQAAGDGLQVSLKPLERHGDVQLLARIFAHGLL